MGEPPGDAPRLPPGATPVASNPLATLPIRSRIAIGAGRAVAGASRLAKLGTGSVIGGRVSLAIDPTLLGRLTRSRQVVLISGTNGKTTTTHLLAAALNKVGPVVSNSLGANMPAGLVAALGPSNPTATAALEVDERWVPHVLDSVGPSTLVLLNLSRDQLDRSHEVRKIADRWRGALAHEDARQVIASADDPLVVWAASRARSVEWVGTGLGWTLDAGGCPQCAGRIEFEAGPGASMWRCAACGFARPEPAWWLDGDDLVHATAAGRTEPRAGDSAGEVHPVEPGEQRWPLALALPGRANSANAAMVATTAHSMGVGVERAIGAMREVTSVAGRYGRATIRGREVRMFLAKNPAGWVEAIDMLAPPPRPVIAAINARIADGRDPSWLWDVPYERLGDRFVAATGERRHDLGVRLLYAEIRHGIAESLEDAVNRITEADQADGPIDLIGNYTAFQDYLDQVGRSETANLGDSARLGGSG